MLRLSEHYVSVQGEGPNVGALTQFVRFAGCNMRCPGWPCDTEHAINPEIWRHESKKVWPEQLFEAVVETCNTTGARNICLTGGEPFMQKHEELHQLALLIETVGHMPVEVFTNGSFTFPEWRTRFDWKVMMDWKLEGSGEAQTRRDVRTQNAMAHREGDGVKYVVKDFDDLGEALGVYQMLETNGYQGTHWVGRVWDAGITDEEIVNFMITMGLPWKLNIQMHKYIWPADERGV